MSETVTMTPTDFLLERITEREADVRSRGAYAVGHTASCIFEGGYEGTGSCDCGAVARELAECEAKRRIVEMYPADDSARNWDDAYHGQLCALEDVLAVLALPYVDHPDYDEDWRP